MEDGIIDLTEQPTSPVDRKRARDTEHPAAQLDSTTGVIVIEEEEGEETQRQRIMQFARNAARIRGGSSSVGISSPASRSVVAACTGAPVSGTPTRTLIKHADQINAECQQASYSDPASLNITNSLLSQLHAERMARRATRYPSLPASPGAHGMPPPAPPPLSINILSYNVWFREDVALLDRMNGMTEEICRVSPDVICLQEMTPAMYALLSTKRFWKDYKAHPAPSDFGFGASYFTAILCRHDRQGWRTGNVSAIEFSNSIMGRDLKAVTLTTEGHKGGGRGATLRIGTAHLESPCRGNMHSEARKSQCEQSLKVLDATGDNVVFIGDMNWNERNDGTPPFPSTHWVDAWAVKHPENPGYTYDARENAMLRRGNRGGLRLRLDRAFCKLNDWEINDCMLIGTSPVAGGGVLYEGRSVLPSDHYGLLLKLHGKSC